MNVLKHLSIVAILGLSTLSAEVFHVKDTKSFRDALENATYNGEDDTIFLDKGVYKTTDDKRNTFTFEDGESFGLTITAKEGLANTDVVLDGDHKHPVLQFHRQKGGRKAVYTKIEIQNISIKNGYYKGHGKGGALYLGAETTEGFHLKNIIFANNAAKSGGAVYEASRNNSGKYATSLIVDNCYFHNNSAKEWGGAFVTNTYQHVIIRNSKFEKNSAKYEKEKTYGKGGAIYSNANRGLEIENCIFKENSAHRGGGALFINKGVTTITNSEFRNNKATEPFQAGKAGISTLPTPAGLFLKMFTSSRTKGGYGGAISVYEDRAIVLNSLFESNSGALVGALNGSAIVLNSLFTKNSSEYASAIDSSNLISFNNVFQNNTTTKEGRPALWLGSNTYVINSKLENQGTEILFSGDSGEAVMYKNSIDEDRIALDTKSSMHVSFRKNNKGALESLDDNYLKKIMDEEDYAFVHKNVKIGTIGRY